MKRGSFPKAQQLSLISFNLHCFLRVFMFGVKHFGTRCKKLPSHEINWLNWMGQQKGLQQEMIEQHFIQLQKILHDKNLETMMGCQLWSYI